MDLKTDYMVEFNEVSKAYTKEIGKLRPIALSNVSFTVQKGETLGLIGANGAGKSTCIRLIMDFIRPTEGALKLMSLPPEAPYVRKNVGYLPEVANFPANLTVHDLLKFTASACGVSKDLFKDRSKELLKLLELWEVRKSPLRTYSKGMQQRANFCIALINDPDLLILDEPMSGLDPMGRKKIIDLITDLKERGKTILFCSHILEDVDRLVDTVLLLHKGKKLFYGNFSELAAAESKTTLADAFVSRVQREENDR